MRKGCIDKTERVFYYRIEHWRENKMQIVTKNDLLEAVQGKAIYCYVSRLTFDISCIMPEVTIGVGDELLCENENLYIEWEHVNKITKETQYSGSVVKTKI